LSKHTLFIYGRPPTRSSLKITNHSFTYAAHLVYETNYPLIFASLVRYSFLHFHLSYMAARHLHHLHYHRLHLIFLAQYFILNSNFASQQILSSIDLFLSYSTDYTDCRTI